MVSIGLPGPGDSLWHRKSEIHRLFDLRDLLRKAGPRPNQAHLAAKHVDQLRDFIEEGPAQNSPNRRDSRVIAHLEEGPAGLIERIDLCPHTLCPVDHRPELEKRELLPILAD